MNVADDHWDDIFVSFYAILCLPFYIGYLDSPVEFMLFYAIIAGLALEIGDRLVGRFAGSLYDLLIETGLRAAGILIVGIIPFAVAIWLI